MSHPGRPAKTMVLPMKPPPNLHMSDLADKLVALWRDENRFCPATVLTEHCRSPPSSQWPSFRDSVAKNKCGLKATAYSEHTYADPLDPAG